MQPKSGLSGTGYSVARPYTFQAATAPRIRPAGWMPALTQVEQPGRLGQKVELELRLTEYRGASGPSVCQLHFLVCHHPHAHVLRPKAAKVCGPGTHCRAVASATELQKSPLSHFPGVLPRA